MTLLASLLLAFAPAPSGAGGSPGGSPLDIFLPLGLTIAIVYFMMLRPQQKRSEGQRKLIENLKKGDHVLANAGFYGRVVEVDKKTVTLDVGNNVKLRVVKDAIATLANPDEA